MSGQTAAPVRAGEPDLVAPPPSGPDLPVTVIERRSGWRLVDLVEVWRYRELLFFLAWRDVKLRYKQTSLGVAWAVLQPLATMVVFSFCLGRMPGIDDGLTYDYALFVFAGFWPWLYFASAVTTAGASVVASQNLVTKVYFPRLLIPTGAVVACLVDFLVGGGMMVALMIWYGRAPDWGVFLAPAVLALLTLTALGVGAFLAALTVSYRDFRYVVPFLVQLWMFATPCIYLPVVRTRWEGLLPLNPAYGLLRVFRQTVLGGPIDWDALALSGSLGLLLFVGGCCYFRRAERAFADVI